jgi:hypothetical protein
MRVSNSAVGGDADQVARGPAVSESASRKLEVGNRALIAAKGRLSP